MLDAGDDPLFVLRRLIIFASEDVGNADQIECDPTGHALSQGGHEAADHRCARDLLELLDNLRLIPVRQGGPIADLIH